MTGVDIWWQIALPFSAMVTSVYALIRYTIGKNRHVTKQADAQPSTGDDWCAGCDKIVLRKAMHWTDDGLWRCRTCDPPHPKVDPWLSDKVGPPPKGPGAVSTKRLPGCECSACQERQLSPQPITLSQAWIDANRGFKGQGVNADGSAWSLWTTLLEAKRWLRGGGGGTIVQDGRYYRANRLPPTTAEMEPHAQRRDDEHP